MKAFNHVPAFNLEADPGSEGGRRVLFYAGYDEPAKKSVATLIDLLGFFGVDLGDLKHGSRLFQTPDGPLIAHDLVKIG